MDQNCTRASADLHLCSAASWLLASTTGARPIAGAIGYSLAGTTTAPGGRHAGASAGATHMVPRHTGTVGTQHPVRHHLSGRPSKFSTAPSPRHQGEEAGTSDPTTTRLSQVMITAERPATARNVVDSWRRTVSAAPGRRAGNAAKDAPRVLASQPPSTCLAQLPLANDLACRVDRSSRSSAHAPTPSPSFAGELEPPSTQPFVRRQATPRRKIRDASIPRTDLSWGN